MMRALLTKRGIFLFILLAGIVLSGALLPPENRYSPNYLAQAIAFAMVFFGFIAALIRVGQSPGPWNARFKPRFRVSKRRHRIWVAFIIFISVGVFPIALAIVAVNIFFDAIAKRTDALGSV